MFVLLEVLRAVCGQSSFILAHGLVNTTKSHGGMAVQLDKLIDFVKLVANWFRRELFLAIEAY